MGDGGTSVQRRGPEPPDIPLRRIREIQRILLTWGRNNYADFPWRNIANPFHALIAEIMLQRTRAEQVVPVYIEFIKKYPDFTDALDENPGKIIELISRLGLSWRAEKVIELLDALSEIDGKIPDKKDELIQLPGVGNYIANAFLSLHKGVRAPIMDSNAVRIWSRVIGFEPVGEIRRRKWFTELCLLLTPDRDFREFNYALLDFCRKICKTKPVCEECSLSAICHYYQVARARAI